MTEHKFSNFMAIFIFFGVLFIFTMTVFYKIIDILGKDDFVDLLKILVPIKSVYLTLLFRYIIQNRYAAIKEKENKLSSTYILISSTIVSFHILIISLSVTLYVFNHISDFDSLKNMIFGFESIFGASLGLIISKIFDVKKVDQ